VRHLHGAWLKACLSTPAPQQQNSTTQREQLHSSDFEHGRVTPCKAHGSRCSLPMWGQLCGSHLTCSIGPAAAPDQVGGRQQWLPASWSCFRLIADTACLFVRVRQPALSSAACWWHYVLQGGETLHHCNIAARHPSRRHNVRDPPLPLLSVAASDSHPGIHHAERPSWHGCTLAGWAPVPGSESAPQPARHSIGRAVRM
jgi:hypothetical protein